MIPHTSKVVHYSLRFIRITALALVTKPFDHFDLSEKSQKR